MSRLPARRLMSATAVEIAAEPDSAWCLLVPLRRQLLGALAEPQSAAGLARELGLPRQKINYHLRELERAGLVEEFDRRKRGNLVERRLRAKATTYLVHPSALTPGSETPAAGDAAAELLAHQDRFSSAYLAEAAAQVVRDLAELRPAADAARQRLATHTQLAEVRFATAAARNAFAAELTGAVAALIEKYHRPAAAGGRPFRLLTALWPGIRRTGPTDPPPAPTPARTPP